LGKLKSKSNTTQLSNWERKIKPNYDRQRWYRN